MSDPTSICWSCAHRDEVSHHGAREYMIAGAVDAFADPKRGWHVVCLVDPLRVIVNCKPRPHCGFEQGKARA